jgi:hypothetical protein
VLGWALDRAGVAAAFVDHDPPRSSRSCGHATTSARHDVRPSVLAPGAAADDPRRAGAGPVRYGARAVYWSDIAVRAGSPARTLRDTLADAPATR